MTILGNGGRVAPPSLVAICWAEFFCKLPLAPLTLSVFRRLDPPEDHAIYWVLTIINSFLAVFIIFFLVRGVRKLLRSRSASFAYEKT
jgi:hypothetical protein